MLFRIRNDPAIEAVACRVRDMLERQPQYCVAAVAQKLAMSPEEVCDLLTRRDRPIDMSALIDLIAALVHECGLDPKWLLTGEYDGVLHRQALVMGEDRSAHGANVIRDLVHDEYRRLQRPKMFAPLPSIGGLFSRQ